MEHSQALAILLAFAERPDSAPPGIDAALVHMGGCPVCAAGTRQLAAALRLAARDRLTCAECEELLPAYVAVSALGQGEASRWAAMRVHLVGCPACTAALADLAELQAFAEGAIGVAPPSYPAPRPSPAAARAPQARPDSPWRIDELGRLLVDLARSLLPAGPSLSPAGLKSEPAGAAVAAAQLADTMPDLQLQLVLERSSASARRLLVTVDIPSRGGWPNLGGSEVTLLDGAKEVAGAITDSFGTAVFAELSDAELGRLTLAVRPIADDA